MRIRQLIPPASRLMAALFCALFALALGASAPRATVETSMRFLEYDHTQGLLAYEITVRNLGGLPVSHVFLSTDPPALEGTFELSDLAKEERSSRRFTFRMPAETLLFQPRFLLAYTDYEGERIRIEQERPYLAVTVDFVECDLAAGKVAMSIALSNPNPEPVIFLELRSENPPLLGGTTGLGDLGPGDSASYIVHFSVEPDERFFNPTLYLDYHAFHSEGTRIHRSFYTILQPDLGRIEAALSARAEEP